MRFAGELAALGLDPVDYVYPPVHPWQWVNKLAVTFAPDVARRELVVLGEGADEHRPQQSIRTFFNVSRPERHYVKTALSIQNMGFMRGLSPAYMSATPAINEWVAGLVSSDDELRACGFGVLREVAAIGYTGDVFHALPDLSPRTAASRCARTGTGHRDGHGVRPGRVDLGPDVSAGLSAPARALSASL